MYPMPTGWAPSTVTSPVSTSTPPQYVLDELARAGFQWDANKYRWDADTKNIIDNTTGGQWWMGDIADPSLGSYVVLPYGTPKAGSGGTALDENPFGFGGQAYYYGANEAQPQFFGHPGNSDEIFVGTTPEEIQAYKDSARDRAWQGIAQVGALVGGAAALGATPWGSSAPGAAASTGTTAATTFPYVAGGPVTVTPLAGGATAGGAAAASAGGILDSSGAIIPGTQAAGAAAGGGGMWENILGGLRNNWGSLAGGLLGYLDANNQPDSMTSIYAPDAALTEAGRGLLGNLGSIYSNGYTPAGVDPATTAAIQRLQGFGGDAINPYLDRVFNSAADATRSRLSSEFARAGRNVGGADHAGFRSDELQALAADIYGRGYESERNRELASVAPLLAAGEYSRGISQEQLDAPMTGAMQYMAALNGLLPLFPGTNTQPLFSNPWAGFLGGAQLGRMFQG